MVKQFLKKIVVAILQWEAKLVIAKYKPKILGITGSVGKTRTKDAVAAVLARRYRVRASAKSFNSELGLPLTVLNCANAWSNIGAWLINILEGLSLIFFRAQYPEWLILEVGIDRPGDIARLVKWLKLDVVVITSLPEVPVHVEYFATPAALRAEKLLLIKTLKPEGLLIVNSDDKYLQEILPSTANKVLKYGFEAGADLRATQAKTAYEGRGEKRAPSGLSLKVHYQDQDLSLRAKGTLGAHQAYAYLAALAVGVSQGLELGVIGAALEALEPTPGRLCLMPGIKQTWIIDDTYNSSPAALTEALKTLKEVECAGKRIAVLGDMLELGTYTIDAHKQAGAESAKVADLLITVGVRAKFIRDEALAQGLTQEHVKHFDESRAAGQALQELLAPGDVVLIKGSQSIRMERVVEEVMLHPEEKEKLLVRQDEEWLRR